jgi:hypothetical protein
MATPTARPTEMRINVPEPFDGDRQKTKQFLNKVVVYLSLNGEVYNTDERKIGYTLALMDKGLAERWANTWRDTHIVTGTLNFGTWAAFYTEVEDFFKEEGGPMKAAIKLANIKMSGTADAYVDQFKDLVQRAGLTNDIAIIRDFEHGLKKTIVDLIYSMDTLPTDPNGWYNAAIRFDNRQRNRRIYESPSQQTFHPTYPAPVHDPNAMVVDKLSMEERRQHMASGLCFKCHKLGHISKDHKNGKLDQGTFQSKGNNYQARVATISEVQEEPVASTSGTNNPFTKVARLQMELGSLSAEERIQVSDTSDDQKI